MFLRMLYTTNNDLEVPQGYAISFQKMDLCKFNIQKNLFYWSG